MVIDWKAAPLGSCVNHFSQNQILTVQAISDRVFPNAPAPLTGFKKRKISERKEAGCEPYQYVIKEQWIPVKNLNHSSGVAFSADSAF